MSGIRPSGKSRRVDYKEVLSEEDFALFAKLREERKKLAAAEAVPVYAVCINEQMAEMAKNKPLTAAALKEINGFGEAKAGKYGEAFLNGLKPRDNPEKSMETGNEAGRKPD